MAYIYVDVDEQEVLDDMSVEEIQNYLRKRTGNKKAVDSRSDYIPTNEAVDTLNRASDEFRKMGRNDLAFRLEEIRTDYVQ